MQLFDLAFWRNGRDKFAHLVRRRLIAAGERRAIRYDKPAFALRIAGLEKNDGPIIFLEREFAVYNRLPAEHQPAELDFYISSCRETDQPLPGSFIEAADRLMPCVRPMVEFGIWQLVGQLEGSGYEKVPFRHLTPEVGIWLAYDQPYSIPRISNQQLALWDVTFEHALDIALANLRRRSAKAFVALAPGLYGSDWNDNYDNSRLLLTDAIAALPVRGAPLAMMPDRNVLLVTGTEEPGGLSAMVRCAQKVLDEPRSLEANALLLDAGIWRDFIPDSGALGGTDLIQLQEGRISQAYADQKHLLEKVYEKTGKDIFVATHAMQVESVSGRFHGSIATWTAGVDSLLPKAQNLALVQPESGRIITASWDAVAGVVGGLLEPMGWWPERFRVRRHPVQRQIEILLAKPGVGVRPIESHRLTALLAAQRKASEPQRTK